MVAKNAVSFPVEERRYRNDELKKTIRYVYRADENTRSGFSLAKIMESSNDANTEFVIRKRMTFIFLVDVRCR